MARLGKVCVVVAVASLLLLLGAGASGAAKEWNIGVVFLQATRSGWNQGVADGIKLGFAKYPKVNWSLVDAMGDHQRHISNIENMISKGVNGMIVVGGYTDVLNKTLKKVKDAKISLMTVDIPSPSSICNVTSDNYYMGAKIALEIVRVLQGEGKVMVIHSPGWLAMDIRRRMLSAVFQDFPGIKVVNESPWDASNLAPRMMADTEAVLGQHPDLDVIWCPCDAMALICAQAANSKGFAKKVKVFGFDGDPVALKELRKDSSFYMTMAQDTHKLGSTAVDFLMGTLEGTAKDLPFEYYVPSLLVTRGSVVEAGKDLYGDDFWK